MQCQYLPVSRDIYSNEILFLALEKSNKIRITLEIELAEAFALPQPERGLVQLILTLEFLFKVTEPTPNICK